MRFALRAAVFLAFGSVFAQSQGAAAMLPRSSLSKSQKSTLRTATVFLKTLWLPGPDWVQAAVREVFE